MIHIHYNNNELMCFVKANTDKIESIQTYKPQNANENSIIQDLLQLLRSKNYDEASRTIINAGSVFKCEFNYTPVTNPVAYFKGEVPMISKTKMEKFIQRITTNQR